MWCLDAPKRKVINNVKDSSWKVRDCPSADQNRRGKLRSIQLVSTGCFNIGHLRKPINAPTQMICEHGKCATLYKPIMQGTYGEGRAIL